ncbi:MAG: TetR family transcriptional regulator [Anaerolineae bacterium]|nr:TetR family transcriptional regulator [Anaerolineae bacterium]
MNDKDTTRGESFITSARRTQIIQAAIKTLDEIGYVKASLAQIARRAGISTALISYHFKDKDDLMNHTLIAVLTNTTSFVLERTQPKSTYREKLHTYILSSLTYQTTHRDQYHALVEIIFHARTPDNIPYYRFNDGEEDPLVLELQTILSQGQKQGEFRDFNVPIMANAIQGAIGEYMGSANLYSTIDAATYGDELVKIFDSAVLRGR